jgi:type II secretory pathway pseudopilin PulG
MVEPVVRRGRREAGFSVVEGLVAAAILLIIAIGLLPLFTRSILNNARGSDYTQATSHAASDLEDLQRLPFDNNDILLAPAASALDRAQFTSASFGDGHPVTKTDWGAGAPPVGNKPLWVRNTEVMQFGISALDDGVIKDEEALPGGTAPIFVQLKQVEVEMVSGKADSAMGGISPVRFRLLKSF